MTGIDYLDARLVHGVAVDAVAPRNPYASGYGSKIPTAYRLQVRNGTRRVYAMCYGNASSLYVIVEGKDQFLGPDVEALLVSALAWGMGTVGE